MSRCVAVTLTLGIAVGAAAGAPPAERAAVPQEAPDIAKLIQQAGSDDKGKAFEALLKLRDRPDQRAIPVLERTLVKYAGTTYTDRFVAAQALFCIGTKRARQILTERLLTDDYPAQLGIRYAFHWKTEPDKRHAFIEKYHLLSTSRDLSIKFKPSSAKQDGKQVIDFAVTLTNVSKRKLKLQVPRVYLGNMLLLRSAEGRFIPKMETVYYYWGEPITVELPVGASHALTITGSPAWWGAKKSPNLIPKPGMTVLDCKDVVHFLGKPGKYKVYAVYSYGKEAARAGDKIRKPGELESWYGQVVSKPVEVEIAPVEAAPPELPARPAPKKAK